MESIINWVRNLIFIILFTTLLEMFLPDSSMRKYVRLVMGFFIIMIFITPLAAVFNRNITTVYQVRPETNIFSGDWEEIKRRGEEIGQSNEQLLAGYYRERIAERVRAVIALDYG
ncbi:MAG TPA: stage III sporulation protein AF, partial [Halanaerobiales bacterium]|nr:stage III sporulation protein AF [Halanaerobiales bacterium]